MNESTAEVNILLMEWGKWVGHDSLGLHARSPMGLILSRHMGSTIKSSAISDEVACLLDHEMASLRRHDSSVFDVLFLYFVGGLNKSQIGRELHISRNKVREMLHRGALWISNHLLDAE